MPRTLPRAALALFLAAQAQLGQEALSPPPAGPASHPALESTTPAPSLGHGEKGWDFSAALSYVVSDSRDFVQPTFTADRGSLHLEARYNYESLDTASAWIGYNLQLGKKLALAFTPMAGVIFGETSGIAPGYRASLSWWKIEFYTEGEFVLVPAHPKESFFYSWKELSVAPVEWARLGLVAQRTKLYQTKWDIQRGFLAGISFWKLDLTAYLFNPDEDTLWMFAARAEF